MTDVHSGVQEAVDAEVDEAGPGKDEQRLAGLGQDLHDEAEARKDEEQMAGAEQTQDREAAGIDSSGTATKDRAASGLQDNGLQSEASDSQSKLSHDTSIKNSVMAALNLLPSWTLQNQIHEFHEDPPMNRWHDLEDAVARILKEADVAAECPFATNELINLARPIVAKRFAGQKKYKDRLKAAVSIETWRQIILQEPDSEISVHEYSNEEYEKWLDAGDASIDARQSHLSLDAVYSLLHETFDITSAYELDLRSADRTCGCLQTFGRDRTNINLRWMCELGDCFEIPPAFFVVYLTSPLRPDWSYDWRTIGGPCFVKGVIAQTAQGGREFVKDQAAAREIGVDPDLSSAYASISCIKLVDSFFVVLHGDPLKPLNDRTYFKGEVTAMPLEYDTLAWLIYGFFADDWNARRLAKLLSARHDGDSYFNTFGWLLSLSAYAKRVADLSSEFRKLDYELITMSSKDALNRIKNCRAKVGRLRADIATAVHVLSIGFGFSYPREGDKADPIAMESRLTPRQAASTSMNAEYLWIDNEAASLMPRLNDNLQILIATISLEDAALSRADAAIAKKNGERSTLLTAFAAVYLPLTLATGVFGMNIREIGPDSTPRWWAFISLAAGLTSLSVFCIWLFFTRDVKIERRWQRVLHRITGGWYGNGLEWKKSDEEKGGKLA